MKTLYEAANAIEAHMLCDLLQQQGIHAQIYGEHLQSGSGELPAFGMVRIVVAEADYPQARAVIDEWEATQPRDNVTPQKKSGSNSFISFAIGLALGISATSFYFRIPVSYYQVDHNKDGVVDEKWHYAPNGLALKTEVDRNFDGKTDLVNHFGKDGFISSSSTDDNFDGTYESRVTYRYNNTESYEADTDSDGRVDFRSDYVHGVYTTAHFINPLTNAPLRVEYYNLGKLTHADVDTDANGQLDTKYIYSPLGDITTKERID